MKKLSYLIGLFAIGLHMHGWGNTLTGKISDISGKGVVEGAYIYLYNTNFIDSTDINGEFSIDSVPTGTYTIIIEHPDYVQKVISNFVVTDGVSIVELNKGYQMSVHSYPNPFRNSLNIEFTIDEPQNITIQIMDMQGRIIDVVENDYFLEGKHTTVWNGNAAGSGNSTGNIYFYCIQGANFSQTNKILKIK